MHRDVEAYLWDVHQAGYMILQFTAGKSLEDYLSDAMLRAAVERKFILLGEALTQMRRHFPDQSQLVESARAAIAFRNQVVHEYDTLEPAEVWDVVQTSLMPLVAEVSVLLDEWHEN